MNTFLLQIVTPDGSCFDGQAAMVRLRAIDGDIAVLAGHTPYVTAVGMGECRVVLPDGQDRWAACCGGMLSVGRTVRLIATTFEWAEQIDVPRAQAAAKAAKLRLEEAAGGDEALRQALSDRLCRAQVRLAAAARAAG